MGLSLHFGPLTLFQWHYCFISHESPTSQIVLTHQANCQGICPVSVPRLHQLINPAYRRDSAVQICCLQSGCLMVCFSAEKHHRPQLSGTLGGHPEPFKSVQICTQEVKVKLPSSFKTNGKLYQDNVSSNQIAPLCYAER